MKLYDLIEHFGRIKENENGDFYFGSDEQFLEEIWTEESINNEKEKRVMSAIHSSKQLEKSIEKIRINLLHINDKYIFETINNLQVSSNKLYQALEDLQTGGRQQ